MSTQPTAAETVANAVLKLILRGDYPVGTRLPSERTLATRFEVHRVTARTACQRLAAEGVLEARQGSGYWVQRYPETGSLRLIGTILSIEEDPERLAILLRDVLLMRRTTLCLVLQLLAERASDEELALLKSRIDDFEAAVARGDAPEELADFEERVVASALRATQSDAFELMLNPLARAYMRIPTFQPIIYRDPEQNVLGYVAFLAWLDEPDPEFIDLLGDVLAERDAETIELVRQLQF